MSDLFILLSFITIWMIWIGGSMTLYGEVVERSDKPKMILLFSCFVGLPFFIGSGIVLKLLDN